jgi:hypothetical protein
VLFILVSAGIDDSVKTFMTPSEIDVCVGQARWSQGQRLRSTVRRGVAGLVDRPGWYVRCIGHAVPARRWTSQNK